MNTTENVRFLLQRKGRLATLSQDNLSNYNPATGTYSSSAAADEYSVKAYFGNYQLGDIDNTSVLNGDRRVIMSSVDTLGEAYPTPTAGDKISGLGDAVKVISVQEIYNGTSLICYICQVRE